MKIIETEGEYERLASELEKLDFSKESSTPEHNALAELLARLIEDYEERRYPVPEASPPPEMLRFLMEQRGLRQADLVDLVDLVGSRSLISEIVNGKRAVSKRLAKKLAEHFHVSAEVFL